ncbi:MAG: ribonucleotide reductase N-terminal alpha domain-containing protein [Bacteroidota bacterium]
MITQSSQVNGVEQKSDNKAQVYTFQEALKSSIEYFNGDELAANVWVNKYAMKDSHGNIYEATPDDMHRRIARELARVEKKYSHSMSEKELYNLLKNFKYIVPQGSPMAGIGNRHQISSLSNCFVIGNSADSYAGIIRLDEEQAQLMKRRGGVGHDLSHIRPKGSPVMNSALSSTGIVPFMERYSNCTREVAQDGRRGALMLTISSRHPDAEDFIDAKMEAGKVTGANISVKIDDDFMNSVMNKTPYKQQFPVGAKKPRVTREIDAEQLWNKVIYNAWKSAEPGVLFWDTVKKEAIPDCYADLGFGTVSTNPCLTAETLVAVADGRHHVTIGELAKAGKDVPVYCLDKAGNVVIKTMRNPRLTGRKKKVFKLTLEDGLTIRATENHKFRLKNGQYKQLKDLKEGDSLMILSKFQAPIVKEKGKTKNDYWWMNAGKFQGNKSEHRLIAEFFHNKVIRRGEVVHHKDRNSLNNFPDNLEIMSAEAHNELHSAEMKGAKNPIFKIKADAEKFAAYSAKMSEATTGFKNGNAFQVYNEEILAKAIELTDTLGRRFSKKEWIAFADQNNLPKSFSTFRQDQFNSVKELSVLAAEALNLRYIHVDPRLARTWITAKAQGYTAAIEGNKVLVEKTCEKCGKPFWTEYHRREMAYCSFTCVNENLNSDENIRGKRIASVNAAYEEKGVMTKTKQLDVFTKLRYELDRIPKQKEWEMACKKAGVAYRLKTKYGFPSWSALKEKAQFHNHRVASIEFDSYEDVYSGTVDDHHNYFSGGWKTTTKSGKDKYLYINQLNCGEIPLSPYDSCRLLAVNLFSYVEKPFTKKAKFNFKKFGEHIQHAQRIMDDIIDLEIEKIDLILDKINRDPEVEEIRQVERRLWEKIRKACTQGRRTGVGITAEGDMLAAMGLQYGSDEAIDFSVKVHQTLALNAYRSSVNLAKDRGAFPIYDAKREENNPMIQRIKEADPELYYEMTEHGRRNIALLTIAPTGTTSLMTQTSSGIEPVFMVSYKRRRKVNPNDKDVTVNFVDEVGDSWEEYHVFHHKFMDWLKANGYDVDAVTKMEDEELKTLIAQSPYHNATANDVDWVQKVKMQGAIQKWIDHSISVTVNIPEDTSVEMVRKIYETAWEHGCKGCTIYRDGSRSGVLIADTKKEEKAADAAEAFAETFAPKRPKKLESKVVRFRNNDEQWLAVVGLLEEKPYEIFTGRAIDTFRLPDYVDSGWVIKAEDEDGQRRYDFQFQDKEGYKVTIEGLSRSFQKEYWNYAKLISGILRHGMPLHYVVELIEGLNVEEEYISTWKNGVARALKQFIPDGTKAVKSTCSNCGAEDSLVYQEGCLTCKSCGYSKCG